MSADVCFVWLFAAVSTVQHPSCAGAQGMFCHCTVVPPYPRVIRSKTYRGYVKPRVIPNAIYNVIFV
jgi:hypothetical protein